MGNSTIGWNVSINRIQKFHYLRASLEGDALKVIQALEFSANNYDVAWELICDRFNNGRLLVNNHIKAIFDFEPLNKESSAGLRNIIDTISKHLRALESLNQPVGQWDTLIIFIITSKLDKATARDWEKQKNDKDFPKLEDLKKFLKNKADFLETIEINHNKQTKDQKEISRGLRHTSLLVANPKCNLCRKGHLIYKCAQFLKLSVTERIQKVKDLKLCGNCLCTGHDVKDCKAGKCKLCNNKHSSLLHVDIVPSSEVSLTSRLHKSSVLLSTAIILVPDTTGRFHKAKAILDCGSQSNFVSQSFCKRLKLKLVDSHISIAGINNLSSTLNKKCDIIIKSSCSDFETSISCFVLPIITDQVPSSKIDITSWNIPSELDLADPHFNEPGKIDLLIGAELFWNILLQEKFSLGEYLPSLQNTYFGWIISGAITEPNSRVSCNLSQLSDLNIQLDKFWEIEEIKPAILQSLSSDDELCENHFINNFSRTAEGRFLIRIPLKFPSTNLGDSMRIAIKRFFSLERRLEANQELKDQYHNFIHEYIDLGHMSLLKSPDQTKISYFLPHHGVVRADSLTTRLRVVFDGSSISESGWSLNDLQFTGPPIQNEIISILLRFRQHNFVVSSDVAKMFRQIMIHPEDRHLQQIVWREHSQDEFSIYQRNTVTYGTKSAPFLSIRCLRQLALEYAETFPEASNIIMRDFYVDDLLTGFSSEQEAIATCKVISEILNTAQFPLRKWMSNSEHILNAIRDDSEPISVIILGDNEQSKTLGIRWYSKTDLLTYHISDIPLSNVTKRSILSEVAKIFDPLGCVGPCVIVAKIIIQKLWLSKIGWDEIIPSDLENEWTRFRNELLCLNEMKIDRHVICPNYVQIEAHGFCDASQTAYAACIYLKSTDQYGNTQVQLLCAKTKVAPLKSKLTIPKLELCSALMLSRLLKKVKDSLTIDMPYFLWSDSQVTLCWIQTQPSLLISFVQNRVSEIQSLTHSQAWFYINTKDNPADLASRGVFPKKLINNQLWWHGPNWLSLDRSDWPPSSFLKPSEKITEGKRQVFVSTHSHEHLLFNRFSCLRKLKNTLAYCLRFISNCQISKEKRSTGILTVEELATSLRKLLQIAQNESFAEEISLLKNDKDLNSKHRLLRLSPFLDSDRLLRVGGRLKHSSLHFDGKHPILLSKNHILTKLIFEEEHKRLLHPGPQLLLATVRQNYWSTSGMSVAKKITHNCIRCFKFRPKNVDPIMAQLPKERVTCSPPFSVTGVDYAGPFTLKDRKGRGSRVIKGYVCLFICFSSKAVHLELVTDLTTENFIAALRRFTSRRGKPSHIYSDNGTNFVGAAKELTILSEFFSGSNNEIEQSCANESITWHFIPPNSPHFGGLWESGVKGAKHHLLRVIGETKLTYEEFNTILIQVEATLNSRPLYPLSSDPNDIQPLSPAHFLIGRPLVAAPDPNILDIPINKLSRFQLLQRIQQDFWRRWSRDYLSHLQQKNKWAKASKSVTKGTLVLIKQDNLPPRKWLLGRIIELNPADDGVVRVVSIKTHNGILKRAVSRLCPLPEQVHQDNISE